MKQQLRPTGHDKHDAMLIARLYGGDVSAAERDIALERLGDCEDCAQLFADLGAISEATSLLPAPPRPRDFTLTEADAAALGRSRTRGRFGWGGLRRSLGGALAALGLVGVLLSGTGSLINPASHSSPERAAFDMNSATTGPAAPGQPVPGPVVDAAGSPQQNLTAQSPQPSTGAIAVATQAAASPSGSNTKTAGGTTSDITTTGGGSQVGPATEGNGNTGGNKSLSGSDAGGDLRPLAFLGFGLALLIGLALLMGPRFARIAARAVRR